MNNYKKLHFQLSLLCAAVLGLVLLVMSIFCLFISFENQKANQIAEFQQTMNLFSQSFSSQETLSHDWLNQTASTHHLSLSILDNGIPLLYSHEKDSLDKNSLFSAARQTAHTVYGLSEDSVKFTSYPRHIEFFLNRDCLASVLFIPKTSGVLTVTALSFPWKGHSFLKDMVLPMLVFTLFTAILLSIFCSFLIHHLLKPLALIHQQQVSFFSAASHELRSPLTVILSALSAMKQAGPKTASSLCLTAERESHRMQRLINDMFTLSFLDTGRFSIKKQEIDMKNLLIEAYEKYELLAYEKQIQISFSLPDLVLPPCFCDLERILQVISILMDNALSYTPTGGAICISLEYENRRFSITVEDNGPGIPDELKEKVFSRFYRRDPSRTDKNHFGLGLSIAREITRLHGGKLLLTDSREGGASFTLLLPEK